MNHTNIQVSEKQNNRELHFFDGKELNITQKLNKAHICLIFNSGLAPSLIHNLALIGVGKITIVSDDSITQTLTQHSMYLRPEDEQISVEDLLKNRFSRENTEFVLKPRPNTMVQWLNLISDVDLVVAPIDGPILFHSWLSQLNSASLQCQKPIFMGALLDGKEPHVGPFLIPKKTACYTCFEYRYKSNMSQYQAYEPFEVFIQDQQTYIDFGTFPPMVELVGSFMANEIRTFILDGEPITSGKLVTVSAGDYGFMLHPVLKIPRCPSCSPT